MRGKMIILEGLDFVGKTTIAKIFGAKEGWAYYKTPPQKFFLQCTKLTASGSPSYSEKKFFLFIKSLEYASEEISELQVHGISVAVDRWVWSTLAYHFAFNRKLERKWIRCWHELAGKLIKPDKHFLVYISDKAERGERIRGRIATPHDKKVLQNQTKEGLISFFYRELNPDFIYIDNSGNIQSTIDEIRANI